MVNVKITTDYITLGQFLKFVGIISNGCEAKVYLAENQVHINNELDTRRGRKIYPGDVVLVENKTYKVTS